MDPLDQPADGAQGRRSTARPGRDWLVIALAGLFSVVTLVYPVVRAFYHVEIDYNEGWNVYNTQSAMNHVPLYFPQFGWTSVNYPPASFYMVGLLSGVVGDYLLTGRLVSLVAMLVSCVLVTLIVRKLASGWAAAVFAGVFCLGLLCTRELGYVAMDDPQMLAHPFFLLGLFLYLNGASSWKMIAAIAFLMTLGGSIKHNLIPAPVAVFGALATRSVSQAGRFLICGLVGVVVAIVLSTWIGGQYFVSALLLPRQYSIAKMISELCRAYLPLGVPLALCLVWSIARLADRQLRVIALYFFASIAIGTVFVGGDGVYTNAYRDSFLAMSIVIGLCLDDLWRAPVPLFGRAGRLTWMVPGILYLTIAIMFGASGRVNLPKHIRLLAAAEQQFDAEVAFIREQPGPAICESLLRCYYAGKPYVYDPFNSKRMIQFGKLDGEVMIQRIAHREFGAVQTSELLPDPAAPAIDTLFFPASVIEAIARYYVVVRPDVVVDSDPIEKCLLYLPRPGQP